MKFFQIMALLLFSQTLHALENGEDEYVFSQPNNGKVSKERYFDDIGVPNVKLETRRIKKCKKNCSYPVIVDQSGKILKKYGTDSSISVKVSGRYQSIAFLQYSRTFPAGDKTKTKLHFIDSQGQFHSARSSQLALASLIGPKGYLYTVKKNGIYKEGEQILSIKGSITHAVIANNPQGDIAVVAISKTGKVLVSNTKKWLFSGFSLAEHGDRKDVLSVYPENKDLAYISVYKYVNSFNKGLMAAQANFTSDVAVSGWLINSAERNVGWASEVYLANKQLRINAEDSSNRKDLSFSFSSEQFEQIALPENSPSHTQGYEEEPMLSFLVGGGLAHLDWEAKTEVKDHSEMNYDIGSATYQALYFEGRILDTQLSISYLKNEAETKGELDEAVTEVLNFVLDFDRLFINTFGNASTLRLGMSTGKVNGVYDYQNSSNLGPISKEGSFKTEVKRYSALVMAERGLFFGLEYSDYQMPSALGFSNSDKNVEYLTVDEDFRIQNYMLQIGYDEISYAKRYETTLSRFFIDGHIGLGASVFDVSNKSQNEVESATNKSLNTPWSLVLDSELGIGYIWQQRFKSALGLGYSFTLGYKARASLNGMSQGDSSEDKIEDDELALDFQRYDIWHGPYATANIIF